MEVSHAWFGLKVFMKSKENVILNKFSKVNTNDLETNTKYTMDSGQIKLNIISSSK